MDNVSHSLTVMALSRAGLNRLDPLATPVLLISGNIPDIDIIAFAGGSLSYLEVHRGYTHSLLGIPFMALASVLIVWAFVRRRINLAGLFALACLGVGSHLLLDWTNSYGVRFLLPWSSAWYHLDWNALTDYLFVSVLLLAFLWPYFERLVRGEIGARRAPGRAVQIFTLVLIVVLETGRSFAHAHAIAQMNTVTYEDENALHIAALPRALNPFEWRGVVEIEQAYKVLEILTLAPLLPGEGESFRKLDRDAAINVVRSTEPFRYFQYFARFPVWTEEPQSILGQKTLRIDLTDLRFSRPGEGAFHCVAVVDQANRVLSSRFVGWGSGADDTMGTNASPNGSSVAFVLPRYRPDFQPAEFFRPLAHGQGPKRIRQIPSP